MKAIKIIHQSLENNFLWKSFVFCTKLVQKRLIDEDFNIDDGCIIFGSLPSLHWKRCE